MKKTIFSSVLIKSLILLVFCLVSTNLPVYADGDKRISAIKITGNNAVSTATIISRLKIKVGDVYMESAVNKEIKRLYATGYFADVFVETKDQPEGVVVTFTVVEKPIIRAVEFRGNARIKTAKLEKKLDIKNGVLLDFHALSQDVAQITNFYVEQGYSNVRVDYRIETEKDDQNSATVIFVIDEGIPLKIKSIDIVGNKKISDAEIKKYMSTKTAFFFLRKGAFNEEKFQADLNRIRNLLRSKGFLDARVSSEMAYSPDGNGIYLTVIIDEGKQYLTGETIIKGVLNYPQEDIRYELDVHPGDIFDYSRIQDEVDEVRAFYYDKGYMDAEIDLQHKYNPTTDSMDLAFNINSHNVIYVGKINVLGNTKTRDGVVRRELRVYPGDRYDGKKLKKSKERIYNLGFFEDVYLETVPTSDPDVKDLNVTIKETKTGELSFGGGYSSVDSFLGFVQIRQKNFDILNFPTFTGAGQNLTIRGEIGATRTNYVVNWTDPWIFGLPYLFGFELYRQEHSDSSISGWDYDEMRMGGALKFGKAITDELSTGLTYNLEEVKISDIPDDSSQDLKDELGTNYLSRLTWTVAFDNRDNKYSPKKGFLVTYLLENAGGPIGGDKNFMKTSAMGAYYHTFFDVFVLEVKGRGGLVEEYGNSDKVPIYERFFAGGATTIRGYKERAVGPRDSKDKNLAIGGRARVIGNLEVTFPILKNLLKGAVFFDVGAVHADVQDLWLDTDYKQGAGIGVRIKTPIGPLKLDYGYPLSDNGDDKKEGQFYFSVSHGF